MSEDSGSYCPHCGAPDQHGRFCMACGEAIGADADTTADEEDEAATASAAGAGEDAFEWADAGEGAESAGASEEPGKTAAEAETAQAEGGDEGPESASPAPTWPLWVLAALVPTWIVGVASYQAGGPLAALAGLAVLASLPLLYLDATWASEAGELDVDYPIAVPVACLLLWVLAVPAYVGYRVHER